MDSSPASAADMLLQRHRSSLQSAAAAAPPAPPAPTTAGGGGREADADLERMMQAARWGGGGSRQQQGPPTVGTAPSAALPRMQPQPQSPVILPAREARQPDIVRHEAADVYDVLEFRLRNNDRDLKSLLSRSNDRLAKSEQQQPPPTEAMDLSPQEEEAPPPAAVPTPCPESLPPPPTKVEVAAANAAVAATATVGNSEPGSLKRPSATGPAALDSKDTDAATTTDRHTPINDSGVEAVDNSACDCVSITNDRDVAADTTAAEVAAVASGAAAAAAAAEAAESGGEVVVTPTRPTLAVEGLRGGTATATASAPPVHLQRVSIGGTTTSNIRGGGSACSATTALGAGGSNMAGFRSGREMMVAGANNNIDGVLGTPPRLPRPQANSMIVQAATEAARWLAVDDSTWHQGQKFMYECTAVCPQESLLRRRKQTKEQWRELKINGIKAAIAADPSLATLRHINKSAFPMDGWTPLHAAAARGNIEFVKVLLEVPEVSAWSVDLQGRTALALAAEGGHLELCLLLKARMERESADTVVGINAPVDLSGRTPLAWSVKAKSRNREVEGHLYAAGDASVCPATPAALRSDGGTARTGLRSGFGGGGGAGGGGLGGGGAGVGSVRTGAGRGAAESVGDGLPCGYSDAPGWRIEMEDAICRHNPIPVVDPEAREAPPPDPTSMFGIFDGHGGSFTSKFCARELVKCLQATPGWKSGDRALKVLCPAVMEAFVNCDELLAKEPRMVVKEVERPSNGKRFEARDSSGSTAVVGVVTSEHVIVANAGDSRAILVMVAPDHKASGGIKTSTSSNGNKKKSDMDTENSKKGTAETIAAALGLKLSGRNVEGSTEATGTGAVLDGGAMASASEAATPTAAAAVGELNDSVRLDEQEGDEEDGEDGCDFEGAEKIRQLLESMMLGEEGRDEQKQGGDVQGGAAGAGMGGQGADDGVMVTAISRDHTAKDEAERERVTAAGGKAFEVPYSEEDGTQSMVVRTAYDDEVQGQSVVPTRGFGDLYYKQRKGEDGQLLPPAMQVVTSCPEIMVHTRGSSGKEELLLMACDGVWDVFDDQDAGEFLVSTLDVPLGEITGEHLAVACDALVNECLRRGSTDNITALAVSLGTGPPPPPSAVGGRILFSDGQ